MFHLTSPRCSLALKYSKWMKEWWASGSRSGGPDRHQAAEMTGRVSVQDVPSVVPIWARRRILYVMNLLIDWLTIVWVVAVHHLQPEPSLEQMLQIGCNDVCCFITCMSKSRLKLQNWIEFSCWRQNVTMLSFAKERNWRFLQMFFRCYIFRGCIWNGFVNVRRNKHVHSKFKKLFHQGGDFRKQSTFVQAFFTVEFHISMADCIRFCTLWTYFSPHGFIYSLFINYFQSAFCTF